MTDASIEIWAEPHSFLNYGRVIDIGRGDAVPNPTSDNYRLSFSDAADGNHQFMGLRPGRVDTFLTTPVNRVYHHVIVWAATGGPGGGLPLAGGDLGGEEARRRGRCRR